MRDKYVIYYEDAVKVEIDGDEVTVSMPPLKFKRPQYIRNVPAYEEAYRVVTRCESPDELYRKVLTKAFQTVRPTIHSETPD